ncbi:MAG: hypothetical protein M3004_12240 [Bacteroidota bacterium]|nr:hypothetical protein [Bacteroidota bacterium]
MKHKFFLIIFLFFYIQSFSQRKVDTTGLNNYHNKIMLVFYKCNSRDEEVSKVITTKNANDIEVSRMALLQCANDGLKTLTAMEDFEGDASLKYACKEVLNFYKQTAEYDIPQLRDFYLMDEKFTKRKKEVTSKRKLSQQEIKVYNNEVRNYNAAVTRFKQLSDFIDRNRRTILKNWNAAEKTFTDTHLSGYKK